MARSIELLLRLAGFGIADRAQGSPTAPGSMSDGLAIAYGDATFASTGTIAR